ncbi:MAG: SAM hydrolase/SAM-dependent halogenase family protein [Burkholderiales bacterium]
MIYLFTDFGAADIYVGQVKAELARHAPAVAVIDLLHEAPAFRVEAGAHLLAALSQRFAPGSVILAVVDPGVGTSRKPVVLRAQECYFVGPDNGLLSVVAARSRDNAVWEIVWRPETMSRSFHGRDLFAPIAARLALGIFPSDALRPLAALEVQLGETDLAEIVYIDHYGNATTGLRADAFARNAVLTLHEADVPHAEVFALAPAGEAFWYVNSVGLIEFACNRASAASVLGLAVGDSVKIRA